MEKEIFDFESRLQELFAGTYSREKLTAALPIFIELHTRLNFSYGELLFLAAKMPEIIEINPAMLAQNLDSLSEIYNIKSKEYKNLILKQPRVLTLSSQLFDYQVRLVSVTYALSRKDVMKLMYIYPELLFVRKELIIEQIEILAGELNAFGLEVRKCLRLEPRLLFLTEAQIERVKKFLMHKLTLSEAEFQEAAKRVPKLLLFNEKELEEKFAFYYPRYFIKRDFKEIIPLCPEFLLINQEEFLLKINEICEVFELSEKKACEFIRRQPQILFYPSITNKIVGLSKISVGRTYIRTYPEICNAVEISLPLKFIIARILGLDNRFSEIVKMDTELMVSRFLFMQSYELFEHSDLLVSEEEFSKKYSISSRLLKISYKLDNKTLENLCEYYLMQKTTLPHYKDIVFPSRGELLSFLGGHAFEQNPFSYQDAREKTNITLNQHKARRTLKSYGLQDNEVGYVLKKCPQLIFYQADAKKIADILFKYGLDLEEVIKKLFVSPDIFGYSPKDFEEVNNESLNFEGKNIF